MHRKSNARIHGRARRMAGFTSCRLPSQAWDHTLLRGREMYTWLLPLFYPTLLVVVFDMFYTSQYPRRDAAPLTKNPGSTRHSITELCCNPYLTILYIKITLLASYPLSSVPSLDGSPSSRKRATVRHTALDSGRHGQKQQR